MKGWGSQRVWKTTSCIAVLIFTVANLYNKDYSGNDHVIVSSTLSGKSSIMLSNPILERPDHEKVAVIGGAGHIGSYLSMTLQENGFKVTIFDKDPKLNENIFKNNKAVTVIKAHSKSLTSADLAKFGSVIFLGGCTGRKACDGLSAKEVEQENVLNVIDIIDKMSSSQYFIAASTSAISEGTFGAKEDSAVNHDVLDAYSLSMYNRENKIREISGSDGKRERPEISLLRFGTVVGNSPGQRTDLMIPSFFRAAYTTGFLKIKGHNTMRSFLTLDDLARAFTTLLLSKANGSNYFALPKQNRQNNITWNLASFSATVLKIASTISSITGATINDGEELSPNSLTPLLNSTSGFSLDCRAFERSFNFTFGGTLERAIQDFDRNVPDSIIAKGPHTIPESGTGGDVIPCPVCSSTGQQTVLDFGDQPLANDFFPDVKVAMKRPRFPLKLVRCRVCNHYHLSHIVDRKKLFNNYIYQSGTSSTLSNYFEWLAQKVIKESYGSIPEGKTGSILEIACNDGSQLDHFKSKGWRTFGVDPAANLAAIAAKKHTVKNGFWPLDFPELSRGDDLTAITAQNVLAHVPHVVSFLKGCVNVMGPKTKLYVQTSQCNMQQLGQFDTVYHEHISFFTGHSFLKAAELAGLYILSFETTPIHGESCLVTMKLDTDVVQKNDMVHAVHHREATAMTHSSSSRNLSQTLSDRLSIEEKDGVNSEFFATKFSAHANSIRDWLKKELRSFKQGGYVMGGYGAAAKGMVLLHFILNNEDDGSSYLDYVLDDAELKQNTYCPGTVIPVKPTSDILTLSDPGKPLVVLIFAWNFFDEIANKIIGQVKGTRQEVRFLVPFPEPRVIKVEINVELTVEEVKSAVLRKMPFHPTRIPNPLAKDVDRPKAVMVTHQRNEELLMPFFIMNHAPLFDKVIMIDYESNDHTLKIIDRFAPPSWEVIPSSTGSTFDAHACDAQVVKVERQYPNDWLLALTTTEFLVAPQLRESLSIGFEKEKSYVSRITAFSIDGDNTVAPVSYSRPLPAQRQMGARSPTHDRPLHYRTTDKYQYSVGRHTYNGKGAVDKHLDAFIMKFGFAPWPEVKERKINVGKTIPQTDVKHGLGFHHTRRTDRKATEKEYLESQKRLYINFCQTGGLEKELVNFRRLYHEVFGHCEY
eukprot:TRINITY_DN16971_c0_g1_i1.p1 TRINITY_DN16971_c0_g1~~TRINITY_DN16971_c0_g1_i1.p1  ORF type:complete len:1153 (-),score=115.37 TRINITY_DN16971_c0_g1_i1:21-3479(-)